MLLSEQSMHYNAGELTPQWVTLFFRFMIAIAD